MTTTLLPMVNRLRRIILESIKGWVLMRMHPLLSPRAASKHSLFDGVPKKQQQLLQAHYDVLDGAKEKLKRVIPIIKLTSTNCTKARPTCLRPSIIDSQVVGCFGYYSMFAAAGGFVLMSGSVSIGVKIK